MKIINIVILLFYTQHSYACNKPITIQVGAFLSSTFIQQYWMDFALDIEKQMGCPVKVQASSSYKQYLDILISGQGDLFFVPNHYVQALLNKGLAPIIKSSNDAQVYIISQQSIYKHGPDVLIDGTILVPGLYTRAYLELKRWLKINHLENKVKFDFNHSHDAATLLMLEGKYSAAVVLGSIYNKLPQSIKSKYPAIKLKNKSGASVLIKNNTDNVLASAILTARSKINFLTWDKAPLSLAKDPFSDTFSKQLDQYIANKSK